MSLIEIIGIAIALSMDATAVGLATGILLQKVSFRQTFRLAWHFGFFQFMMPVLGWLGGKLVHQYIKEFDHWIAFGFLSFIGIKMIAESFHHGQDETPKDPTRGSTMVLLSIATSIDALAVGLSLSLLGVSIWFPAVVIGIITCACTACALHLGGWVGEKSKLGSYAAWIGGIILLSIGIKILVDHGTFA